MRYLLILLLAACTVEQADVQPIKLTLVGDAKEVKAMCGKDNVVMEPYGCAKQNRSAINSGGACEIVAIRPRGFDDSAALLTLGHELWHCFHATPNGAHD